MTQSKRKCSNCGCEITIEEIDRCTAERDAAVSITARKEQELENALKIERKQEDDNDQEENVVYREAKGRYSENSPIRKSSFGSAIVLFLLFFCVVVFAIRSLNQTNSVSNESNNTVEANSATPESSIDEQIPINDESTESSEQPSEPSSTNREATESNTNNSPSPSIAENEPKETQRLALRTQEVPQSDNSINVPPEAQRDINKLLLGVADSSFDQIDIMLADLRNTYAASPDFANTNAETLNQAATSQIENNEINKAKNSLYSSIILDPHNPNSWNKLAIVLAKQHDQFKAVSCFRIAFQKSGDEEKIYLQNLNRNRDVAVRLAASETLKQIANSD